MKNHTLGISSLFGLIGLFPLLAFPAQAQEECTVVTNVPANVIPPVNCAKIYNATPGRVEQSGAVGQLLIETDSRLAPTVNAFAVAYPSPGNTIFPNNVLETATYANAHLQFDDGTLVWMKPETQLGLSDGDTCEWNPSINAIQQSAKQKLCVVTGSILIMTPGRKPGVLVRTDEATVSTPSNVYMVTRHQKKQRTEIFVFTGSRVASVLTSSNTQTFCGDETQQLQSGCSFRVVAGEYLSVTNQGKSMVKPFDAAAWVVLDPFFAPIRANTPMQAEGQSETLVAQSAGLQPPSALNTLQPAQSRLIKTLGYQQFASYCPISAIKETSFGFAELPPPQFNPRTMPPVIVPQAPLYIPPNIRSAPRPVRGLW